MLNKTYNLELKIKSNSLIDKNILLKNLIVDICNQANSQLKDQKLAEIDPNLYTQ